jgi:hypothetical protein
LPFAVVLQVAGPGTCAVCMQLPMCADVVKRAGKGGMMECALPMDRYWSEEAQSELRIANTKRRSGLGIDIRILGLV